MGMKRGIVDEKLEREEREKRGNNRMNERMKEKEVSQNDRNWIRLSTQIKEDPFNSG